MSTRFLGLDLGGTKCAAVLGDDSGHILQRLEWPSHVSRGPEPMLADIERNAAALLNANPGTASIGVSIGGPLDMQKGIVLGPPNLPGWDRVPLAGHLSEKFGLPVTLLHDAAACALAEYRWGDHAGKRCLIYLTCGTGFGAGILFHGKPHLGAGGHSIEIGHTRYREDGPAAFGKTGSAEAWCAGSGLTRIAAWKHPHRWGKNPPDGRELSSLAGKGDPDAMEVLALNADAVGQVAANLADTLFPDTILIGSLARHLGQPWMDRVKAKFMREAHPEARRQCRLSPATLGDRLQDLSALAAADYRG